MFYGIFRFDLFLPFGVAFDDRLGQVAYPYFNRDISIGNTKFHQYTVACFKVQYMYLYFKSFGLLTSIL